MFTLLAQATFKRLLPVGGGGGDPLVEVTVNNSKEENF
jgi:hypothetical protein